MIAGWDTQWEEAGLDDEAKMMLTDCVEILTVRIVAWNVDKGALDEEEEDEDNDSNTTMDDEPIRLSRAENMRRVREEHIKLASSRKRMTTRDPEDIPDIITNTRNVRSTRTASTMRGKRLLRAAEVSNRLVQDRSVKMNVIGADVEALYPSLEAIQVADIVYKAVMETEVEFKMSTIRRGCATSR